MHLKKEIQKHGLWAEKYGSLLKISGFFWNDFFRGILSVRQFTFLKSSQKDGSYDTQHDYVLRKKIDPYLFKPKLTLPEELS
jgi:hypothetical protein